MNSVPIYLLAFFLEIRQHQNEVGYLKRRLENVDLVTAVNEKSMVNELKDAHLIAVSNREDEVVFNPLVEEVAPGVVVHRCGIESTVTVPQTFFVLARGRYIWAELLTSYLGWLLTAVVCGIAGGLAVIAQGNTLQTWVVAIAVCLLLPLFVCIGLVLTSPSAER